MLEDEFIPADISVFFEKELSGHAVDVDHVGDGILGELQDDEGAWHTRVRPYVKRDDLECDVGKLGCIQEMPELCPHDSLAANLAA